MPHQDAADVRVVGGVRVIQSCVMRVSVSAHQPNAPVGCRVRAQCMRSAL
jgi:hypothetical protein